MGRRRRERETEWLQRLTEGIKRERREKEEEEERPKYHVGSQKKLPLKKRRR